MRRPVLVPIGAAAVILGALWLAAHSHPVVRPIVERFVVLTLAGTVIAALVMAALRSLPEPAVTDFEPARSVLPEPGTLPLELRRTAATFDRVVGVGSWRGQNVGGRAQIHRLGRERLAARNLDPDDPSDADAIRALTGEHLWVLVTTPLERPVRHIDVPAALDRLEAL